MSRLRRDLLSISVLFACLLGAACGELTGGETELSALSLKAVPWPDLSQADQAVRGQLDDQRAVLLSVRSAFESSGDSRSRGLPEAYGKMGTLLLVYEYLEAAEVCFENATAAAPDDYRWSYLHGTLLSMTGRIDSAIEELSRARTLEADYVPASVRLAEAMAELGHDDQAAALFRELIEQQPDLARAIAGLGQIEAAAGNDNTAAKLFERALAIEPAANSLHYSLSQVHRRLGDLERAEAHLRLRGDIQVPLDDPLLDPVVTLGQSAAFYLAQAGQAMKNKRYDIAAEAYQRALELDTGSFGAYRGLAFSLERLGDTSGALEVLERGLAKGDSGDPERDTSQRADLYRRIGEVHVLARNDDAALRAFSHGLEEVSGRADLHLLAANALARSGRFEEALPHYDFVLAGIKNDAGTLVKRGAARINVGRGQDALRDFEQAIEIAPNSPEVKRHYIAALEHLGMSQEAANERRRSGADLGSGASTSEEALLATAREAIKRNDYSSAVATLESTLEHHPSSIEAGLLLGSVLGHVGRLPESARRFRTVTELEPLSEPAWQGELTALLVAADYGQARDRLREGLEVFPRSVSLAHTLARLLACAPEPAHRNGPLAGQLIERVRAFGDSVAAQETAAMALAEIGDFEQAVSLQEQLLDAAPEDTSAAARLDAYSRRQPWVVRDPEELLSILRESSSP